tara:strand:- start:824 stop:1264 length:441 start_codon:yes stop_codon:yes gene_type:complete
MKIFKRPNDDTYMALEPDEGDVEITQQELAQIIAARIAANVPEQGQLIAATRVKAKTMLLQILPLLDSLQVDALTDGTQVTWQGQPTPLAEVIRQLKAGLRSVADMDLSAYETAQQMEDAVQAAYFALALQAPAQVKSAFSALVPK